jgi:hypothetical protein
VSFSLGYIGDTTVNKGGTVYNGDSQAFLTTGTSLGAPTIALEGVGPSQDLYDASFPTFFARTLWMESTESSLWGHQVLGVSCGVASGGPSGNTYYIDGVAATAALTSKVDESCYQPQVTGTFVIGASPTLEVDQWAVQGTVTAALLYKVQLTAAEQAQNAVYIASLTKNRGYAGVPVYSGPTVNHLMMTGDSITDCFGTSFGDCWVATTNQAFAGTFTPVNFGLSGSSAIGSMQAVIARECAYISPGSRQNVVHIFLGTNDLSDSASPPTNQEIGAALAHGIQALHSCAARLGANVKVGIATMLSRGNSKADGCGRDPLKDSYDAYLAANWRSLGADILDDYAATPMGYDGGCTDTTNFQSDKTHPTLAGGNQYLAPIAIASTKYLTSTQTYPACTAAPLTTATTLTAGNICTNASSSGSPVLLTLPNCAGFNGAPFYVRNVSSSTQKGTGTGSATVSIAPPSSQMLNGAPNTVSVPVGSTAMLTSSVASYSGGGCAWSAEVLNPQTTTAVTASSQHLSAGQTVTLTAAISTAAALPVAGPAPSGSVRFYVGPYVIGSAEVNAAGTATFSGSTVGATPGPYSVTAVYSGGGAYAGSTSPAINVTILAPTQVTLIAAPTLVPEGNPVTLTASVKRTGPAGSPTGSVVFRSGGVVLGSAPVRTTGNGVGTATFTQTSSGVQPGNYPVTAGYSGDNADEASTSPSVTVIVTK